MTTKLTDLMTDEHRAKVKARDIAIDEQKANMMTQEWLAICEFGFYYGYEAIKSFNNDELTIAQMNEYIKGARKIHAQHVYDETMALIASKSKFDDYKKIMKPYLDEMKEVA